MVRNTAAGQAVFIRIFRARSAALTTSENPLPHMQAVAEQLAASPELAAACGGLFDLVEAHLGRPLVPECCCSPRLSSDETALVGLLRQALMTGPTSATRSIPYGLPGAIRWAVLAVLRALGTIPGIAGELPHPA